MNYLLPPLLIQLVDTTVRDQSDTADKVLLCDKPNSPGQSSSVQFTDTTVISQSDKPDKVLVCDKVNSPGPSASFQLAGVTVTDQSDEGQTLPSSSSIRQLNTNTVACEDSGVDMHNSGDLPNQPGAESAPVPDVVTLNQSKTETACVHNRLKQADEETLLEKENSELDQTPALTKTKLVSFSPGRTKDVTRFSVVSSSAAEGSCVCSKTPKKFVPKRCVKPVVSQYHHHVRSRTTLMMSILTLFYIINWLPHVTVRFGVC